MSLLDRFLPRQDPPILPGPSLIEVQEDCRAELRALLSPAHGREIGESEQREMQVEMSSFIQHAIPPSFWTTRDHFRDPAEAGPDEKRSNIVRDNRRRMIRDEQRLNAFIDANPSLGLITHEDLEGPYGDHLIGWARPRLGIEPLTAFGSFSEAEIEAFRDRMVQEGFRWEELVEDYIDHYSEDCEFALRGAGVLSGSPLMMTALASPHRVGDVLRTLAVTRLSRLFVYGELPERVAQHNQTILSRPALDSTRPASSADDLRPDASLEL